MRAALLLRNSLEVQSNYNTNQAGMGSADRGCIMFCPRCGAQVPDSTKYCTTCGFEIIGTGSMQEASANPVDGRGSRDYQTQAAQYAVPAYQAQAAPAPMPAYQATPSAAPASAAAAPIAAAVKKLGMRSSVMLLIAVLAIVFMMQAWFSFPVVGRFAEYYASMNGSTYGIEASIVNSADAFSSVTVPELARTGDVVGTAVDAANMQLQQVYGAYGYDSEYLQPIQQLYSSLGTIPTVTMIIYVLWIVCLVALVVGIALRLFTGLDVVLFGSLAATAVLALACIIGSFVINGMVSDGISQYIASVGGASSSEAQLVLSMVKSVITPAFGSIVSLVLGVGGVVSGLLLKDDAR